MIKMIITGGVTTPGGTLVRTCFTEPEIQAAVEEAHLAGRRIGVHCYGGPAATWAIGAGVDIIEHGTFLTDEQLDSMVRHGTFLVSTTSVMRAAAEASHIAPFMRERFRQVSEEYVGMLRGLGCGAFGWQWAAIPTMLPSLRRLIPWLKQATVRWKQSGLPH
jgi:imidazolonepropionase-like amidohydrolase